MNIKAISLNVGKALLVSALFMLLSCGVSLLYGKDSSFVPLLLSFTITFVLGVFPLIFVHNQPALSMHEGLVTIVLSWLLSFLLGMLPYVLWGGEFTVINAWFESVAGYTTTGSTILRNIEALPNGLLFWRSSTQFIGGLGVVIFLLYILPDNSPLRLKLTNLEMSTLSRDGYQFRSSLAIKVIIRVYIAILILSCLSLILAGMPVFDAVNHALTLSATGGFSIKNASIGYYGSTAIDLIVMFFITVSAIHFGLIYTTFATRSLKPLKSPVIRYFLLCILAGAIVTTLSLKVHGNYESWGKAALDGSFAVVNYITTSGFAIADNGHWPLLAGVVLMFAAFQCGCSGSTSGGLKADRMLLSFRLILRQIRHNANPSEVHRITLGKHTVKDEAAMGAVTYLALYSLIILLSALILLAMGIDGQTAITGSISSVSNVGPGLGDIGTAGNYAALAPSVKFIFTMDMMLGRLEIYPVLIVLSFLFTRNR